jgi:hypothetical protein
MPVMRLCIAILAALGILSLVPVVYDWGSANKIWQHVPGRTIFSTPDLSL